MSETKRKMVHYRDEMGEIKKGPWKSEEDEVLINHVRKYGPRDWSSIRSKGLLQRTGKSCRLRWVNKLRPNLKHGVKFSAEEERTVIDLQAQFGNKWAKIATYLQGRTDNDVKNFWSSRQKRLARILLTSSPSSIISSKNSKEVQTSTFHHVSSMEGPNFSQSAAEEESITKSCSSSSSHIEDSETIKKEPLMPELAYPSLLSYEQSPNYLSFPQVPLLQPDFALPLGDPNFFDVQLPIMPSFLAPVKGKGHDSVTPDSFIDDFSTYWNV
ncbi:hypothetical protein ACJIZ3_016255 [Penstemon smallii]|uniref:Uncharacterized protein n=1 Tax=Penstemon smallii TaxID=265156 RepID=A0ABD3RS80_9LAMI